MTVTELYKTAEYILQKAGTDAPAFDALCLTEKIFGLDRAGLIAFGDTQADEEKAQALLALANRRAEYEPLQYILGEWSFMDCSFKVGKGVLIPREDTSEVVGLCLEALGGAENPVILDLCSGSGAIAVVLSKRISRARVTAVEKSEEAFPYLTENIALNNACVKTYKGDIFTCGGDFPDGEFDLIVSNPPYIKSGELASLQKEVRQEPALALDGGKDGYDFYKYIISSWTCKLKPGGFMAFELGEGQLDAVKALMKAKNFGSFKEKLDLGGTQRAIIGTLLN